MKLNLSKDWKWYALGMLGGLVVCLFCWFCYWFGSKVIIWRRNYQQKDFIRVSEMHRECQVPVRVWQGSPNPPHELVGHQPALQHTNGQGQGLAPGENIEMNPLPSSSQSATSAVIFRGQVVGAKQFPWTVALGFIQYWPFGKSPPGPNQSPKTFCTGILLSPSWILTAAHCVKQWGFHYYATAGTDCKPESGGILQQDQMQMRRVRKVFFYKTHWRPGWSSTYALPSTLAAGQKHNADNVLKWKKRDFALVRVEEPFSFTDHVAPIQIASAAETDSLELDAIHVSGWGRREQYNPRGSTKWVSVLSNNLRTMSFQSGPVPGSHADCQSLLWCVPIRRDPEGGIESDTQIGDSGGPWVANMKGTDGSSLAHWRLVGVTQGSMSPSQTLPDEIEGVKSDCSAVEGPPGAGVQANPPIACISVGVRVNSQEKINWLKNFPID